MTKTAVIKEIKEKDAELNLLHEGWTKATGKNKTRFMRMIEKALDERKVLMDIRDGNTK